MLLRMLRETGTGRPAPLARLLALLVVIGMLGITAPVLLPLIGWLLGLL